MSSGVARHIWWHAKKITHLLAVARLVILTLRAVNERRCFCVEAMQATGLFVDKGIILRYELPADLGRIDGGVVGHDEAGGLDGYQRRRCTKYALSQGAYNVQAKKRSG